MNEMQKDNFDMLISAAVVQCVHHDADNLSSVDTSDVPDTSRLYKKVMRNLPGSRRTAVKAIVTLVLAAALLALTACACLPEIRHYVWGVVTEWYGEYFEVSFEQEEHTSNNSTDSDIPTTLTEIEQKAIVTKLPDGYYMGEESSLVGQYSITYYNEDDEWVFMFSQSISDNNTLHMDGESVKVIRVFINQSEALLVEESFDQQNFYSLYWQDGEYRFSIVGFFDSISELISIAESITLE